jgi:hypothetical protein
MHWLAAAILIPLLRLVDSFVGRVLLALGLGFFTYRGIDTSLAWILNQVSGGLSSGNATITGIIGVLRIDQCVTVLLSAVAVRLSLQGIKDGAKRLANL